MSKQLPPNCQARAYAQEFVCLTCGHRWDKNDKDPPKCGAEIVTREEISNELRKLMEAIK
jgi:transcription initiation factor IIE alpha subunit